MTTNVITPDTTTRERTPEEQSRLRECAMRIIRKISDFAKNGYCIDLSYPDLSDVDVGDGQKVTIMIFELLCDPEFRKEVSDGNDRATDNEEKMDLNMIIAKFYFFFARKYCPTEAKSMLGKILEAIDMTLSLEGNSYRVIEYIMMGVKNRPEYAKDYAEISEMMIEIQIRRQMDSTMYRVKDFLNYDKQCRHGEGTGAQREYDAAKPEERLAIARKIIAEKLMDEFERGE